MTLVERLRFETRPAHLALENALPLMEPQLTREAYVQVLQAFSAVVLPLEAQLLALDLPEAFQVRSGLRGHLLLADLRVLDAKPPATVQQAAVHQAAVDWSALTPRQALGALYVLEGSRLGGRLISRHLQGLGMTPQRGGAYFADVPGLPSGRWKAFLEALEREVPPPAADEVISGANLTFNSFLRAWQASCRPNETPLTGISA